MKRKSVGNWRNVSSETGTIATGSSPQPYIGRFAPSPTGPLHFGSLIAAVVSFLEARTRGGKWLVRVEDIDPPREQRGATKAILNALAVYGFEWDGPVTYQSASREAHDGAVRALLDRQLAYRCGCSRRDLGEVAHGELGAIYPGTCRNGSNAAEAAIRVRTNNDVLEFNDDIQGLQSQRLESESGDYIILRKDGLIAYQLAVVVDDHLQGISDIVRGIDLIDSTPRQIWLQNLLGYHTPNYLHIPVATNDRGQKLSKSFGAGEIALDQAAETLLEALAVLGQEPADELAAASVEEIWRWAEANWNIAVLDGKKTLPVGHIKLARAQQTVPNGK